MPCGTSSTSSGTGLMSCAEPTTSPALAEKAATSLRAWPCSTRVTGWVGCAPRELHTITRSASPRSRTAVIRCTGNPWRAPNPPMPMTLPDSMSQTASAGLPMTLSITAPSFASLPSGPEAVRAVAAALAPSVRVRIEGRYFENRIRPGIQILEWGEVLTGQPVTPSHAELHDQVGAGREARRAVLADLAVQVLDEPRQPSL